MQSKGAGPVNRVELESQVLCAALRQSCHNKDRVGAFTSVRELSHLFPDLLPPPEKHDEVANSNKANYYNVLGLKPQSSANSVVAAYLRTVRNFLRSQKVAEARVEYNRILNAGFILRKPRLRLSHDIVVARRWLHEESRLAQMAVQEVTQDRMEAIKNMREAVASTAGGAAAEPALEMPKAAEPAPAHVSAPAATSVPPMPPLPSLTPAPNTVPEGGAPHVVPAPPVVPAHAAVAEHAAPNTVPPVPPMPIVAQSGASDGFVTGVPVPPVPPLPVSVVEPPAVATVPPMPPLPNMSASSEVAVKEAPASVMTEPVPTYEPPAVYTPPPNVFDDVEEGAPVAEAAPQVAEPEFEMPAPMPAVEEPAPVEFSAAPSLDVEAPTAGGPSNDAEFFAAVAGMETPSTAGVEEPVWEETAPAMPAPEVAPAPSMEAAANEDLIEVAPGVFVPASALAEEAKAMEASPDVVPSVVNEAVAAAQLAAEQAAAEAAARAAAAKAAAEAAAAQAAAAEAAAKAAAAEAAARAAAQQAAAQQAAAQQAAAQQAAAQAAAQQAAQQAAAQQAAQQAAAQQAAQQAAAQQAAAGQHSPSPTGNGSSTEFDFPPAAVRAQQMPPAEPPVQRESGRIGNEAAFVFDESALSAPPAAQAKKIPMIIQLLEAAQFITPVEVQAILAQMAFAPNVPVEKLILNAGYVTDSELASVKLGESLLQSNKINMAQFQVAIYDERTSGLRMAESLQVRGWLSVEVRNAIDEFQKRRS